MLFAECFYELVSFVNGVEMENVLSTIIPLGSLAGIVLSVVLIGAVARHCRGGKKIYVLLIPLISLPLTYCIYFTANSALLFLLSTDEDVWDDTAIKFEDVVRSQVNWKYLE